MPNFQIAIDIQAPPARAWAVLVDVERWPEWTPTVTSVERLDRGPLAFGSHTRVRQPKLRPAVWQVTELDKPGGLFTWAAKSPGVMITARHLVESTATGSRVRFRLSFPDGLVRSCFACFASSTSST